MPPPGTRSRTCASSPLLRSWCTFSVLQIDLLTAATSCIRRLPGAARCSGSAMPPCLRVIPKPTAPNDPRPAGRLVNGPGRPEAGLFTWGRATWRPSHLAFLSALAEDETSASISAPARGAGQPSRVVCTWGASQSSQSTNAELLCSACGRGKAEGLNGPQCEARRY